MTQASGFSFHSTFLFSDQIHDIIMVAFQHFLPSWYDLFLYKLWRFTENILMPIFASTILTVLINKPRAERSQWSDVSDALVPLNLWHSAGDEPRLAWIADVWGYDPWMGWSKMSATTGPCVSLLRRLFMCVCVCVCVWDGKKQTYSTAHFNVGTQCVWV